MFPGVFVTGQIEKWQAQNKGEKAHAQSDFRWNAQVLFATEQCGNENVVGVCLAFGYVWPKRFLGRGEHQFARQNIRQSTATMVYATGAGKLSFVQFSICFSTDSNKQYRHEMCVGVKNESLFNIKRNYLSCLAIRANHLMTSQRIAAK